MNKPSAYARIRAQLVALTRPRMLLVIWGALGALFVVYVIGTSAVQSTSRPGAGVSGETVKNPVQDPALLVGDMSKFSYAFSPRKTPNTIFNDDEGGTAVRLEDYRGQTILVNFWATWCAPCKKELPSLDRLAAEFAGENFKVLAVAADPKGREAAANQLVELGVDRVEFLMDNRLALAIGVGGSGALPLTILYDKDGNEVGRLLGEADWASDEAKSLIRRVINQ